MLWAISLSVKGVGVGVGFANVGESLGARVDVGLMVVSAPLKLVRPLLPIYVGQLPDAARTACCRGSIARVPAEIMTNAISVRTRFDPRNALMQDSPIKYYTGHHIG